MSGRGLCQLSGLIYYISLLAGLELIERHPHSLAIYDETTGFTPLGSEATVVYGYKDLRLRNNTDAPLQFHLVFEAKKLTAPAPSPASTKKPAPRAHRCTDAP